MADPGPPSTCHPLQRTLFARHGLAARAGTMEWCTAKNGPQSRAGPAIATRLLRGSALPNTDSGVGLNRKSWPIAVRCHRLQALLPAREAPVHHTTRPFLNSRKTDCNTSCGPAGWGRSVRLGAGQPGPCVRGRSLRRLQPAAAPGAVRRHPPAIAGGDSVSHLRAGERGRRPRQRAAGSAQCR